MTIIILLKNKFSLFLLCGIFCNVCYSQRIGGYVYSDTINKEYVYTVEEIKSDSLIIYTLEYGSINFELKSDINYNSKIIDSIVKNDGNNRVINYITDDISFFVDSTNNYDKLWLFYLPFQLDSNKVFLVRIAYKTIFVIKNGKLYVKQSKYIKESKNNVILYTDFKKLKKNHGHDILIKANAQFDTINKEYIIENSFGELLLENFYNCFRINTSYHITGYRISNEWYYEFSK